MRPKMYEKVQFISLGGVVYDLQALPSRSIVNMTGWGKPEDILSTTTGPYQHGNSPVSYRLQPRTINMTLRHQYGCRNDYWQGRSTLLSQMGINSNSPNAPIPGVLRYTYLSNNTKTVRCLDCFLTRGLVYESLEGSRQFHIQEELQFTANNPIIYDPESKSVSLTTFSTSLVFPVVFPFTLGSYYTTSNITYTGTWETFPVIAVTGPASNIFIENISTGAILRLFYNISSSEIVTFNLNYDTKSITNNLGQNLIQYLVSSDLNEFNITNLVTGGINQFLIILGSYGTGTTINISYYNRYYGI